MKGLWAVKAVVQKSISAVPRSQRVNRRFQEWTGRLRLTTATVRARLEWAGWHLQTFDELGGHAGSRPSDFRVLELGSGWHPIVPLAMVAAGAGEVLLCDLEDLSDTALFTEALDLVLAACDDGSLTELVPGLVPERIELLRTARGRLERDGRFVTMDRLGLRTRPGDIREIELDAPPDLIVSNTVLEHIPPGVLLGILESFRRIAGPGTVMSHLVDMCDHYLYIDGSLTPYHFLRFTERQWRWIDNSIQPMNRLRVHQYEELFRAADIPLTSTVRGDGVPADLDGLPLAAPFDRMDPVDVACKSVLFGTLFQGDGAPVHGAAAGT
jgi:hypothetical protein